MASTSRPFEGAEKPRSVGSLASLANGLPDVFQRLRAAVADPVPEPVVALARPGRLARAASPESDPDPDPFDKLPRRLRTDAAVSDLAYRVYACLVSFTWKGSPDECWPTFRAVAERIGGKPLSHDRFGRAIRELVRADYLLVVEDKTVLSTRRFRLLKPPETGDELEPVEDL